MDPRSLNQLVDLISKDTDQGGYYMMHPDLSATIDILSGLHKIDLFSSYRTRQVPQFCNHFPNLDTEAIDAFSMAWSGKNNWLLPPPYLVPKKFFTP